MAGERLVSKEEKNGFVTPVVAKMKDGDDFVLSFDSALHTQIANNMNDIEVDVPSEIIGSKEEVIANVLEGGLVMYVEYRMDGDDFVDIHIKPFNDSDEAEWWAFVLGQDALISLYNDYRDEFETVREFYKIGVTKTSHDPNVLNDAERRLNEFRDKFDAEHPEDDETVKRLVPLLSEITHKFWS